MLHKNDTHILKLKNDSKSRETWRVNGILKKYRVRCGKPNCRCNNSGKLHGWYWYLIWDDKYKTRKRYVKRKDLDVVRSAIKRGHYWKEEIKKRQTILKYEGNIAMAVIEAIQLKRSRIPYVKTPEDILKQFDKFRDALEVKKVTKLCRWYVVENDYNARLELAKRYLTVMWKDRTSFV